MKCHVALTIGDDRATVHTILRLRLEMFCNDPRYRYSRTK
jgi:hypothetical protein